MIAAKILIRLEGEQVEVARGLISSYRDPENGIHMEVAKDEFWCDCLRVMVNLDGSNGVDVGKMLDDLAAEFDVTVSN